MDTTPPPETGDTLAPKRRLFIENNFRLACASHEALIELIDQARPIVGNTWNHYIAALEADASDDDFVRHLLLLIDELIAEITPKGPDDPLLPILQKYAVPRKTWPVLFENQKQGIMRLQEQCKTLTLNTTTGLQRHRIESNVPGDIADWLLREIRLAIQQDPSKVWQAPRLFWDYHYVAKTPPVEGTHIEDWLKVGGIILDLKYGPASVRRAAIIAHVEGIRANPRQHIKNAIGVACAAHKHSNGREQMPEFLESMLAQDRKQVLLNYFCTPKGIANEIKKATCYEAAPCILSQPAVVRHCLGAYGRSKEGNSLVSPEAYYNQLRKDVLNALRARVPGGRPRIPRKPRKKLRAKP